MAATQPAPRALAAWAAWQAGGPVDDLDPDAQWLLPLLYCHLRALGIGAAALARYASVYRHNWYKNHLRLRALRPTLAALRAQGHAPVLVGGAALAAAYYPALGARPFGTAELYAPGAGRDLAAATLRGAGPPRTRAVVWPGLDLTVLDPVEALVQVLADAGQTPEPSALLWAADAVIVSEQLGAGGWAAVAQRAADRGLAADVQAGAAWLHAAGLGTVEAQPA